MESLRRIFDPLSLWWERQSNHWTKRHPPGANRSGEWPRVRDEHLKTHPRCVCCGGKKHLRVHHVVPFHVDPSRELDPSNLITLCEAKKYGINCHLLLGHLGNWRRWNPLVWLQANVWRRRLSGTCPAIAKAITLWLSESEN